MYSLSIIIKQEISDDEEGTRGYGVNSIAGRFDRENIKRSLSVVKPENGIDETIETPNDECNISCARYVHTQDERETSEASQLVKQENCTDDTLFIGDFESTASSRIKKPSITTKGKINIYSKEKVNNNSKRRRKKYGCNYCDKLFIHEGYLKIHSDAVHMGIYEYNCADCGKLFTRKDCLKKHIDSVHRGIKYNCFHCGKSFLFKQNLKAHVDSLHKRLKVKSYNCPHCDKLFTKNSDLTRHVDSIHTCIKNICILCNKLFSRKDALNVHIDSIHKGIKHNCGHCDKLFCTNGELNQHVKRAHQQTRNC